MHDSNVEERAYKLLQDTIKETWWLGGQVDGGMRRTREVGVDFVWDRILLDGNN